MHFTNHTQDYFNISALLQENLKLASSYPIVMFSWTVSPACKKAKKLLAMSGVEPYVIELDQPWEKGNPIRAVLGRHLGRTSVPMIFIGGQFIGGCDDGPSAQSPGLVPLAFMNRLSPMLEKAGAIEPKPVAIPNDEIGTCDNPFDKLAA